MATVVPEAPLPPPPVAPPRKGRPLLAWLVILALVAFTLARYELTPPADNPDVRAVTLLVQARYFVGIAHLNFPGLTGAELYRESERQLNRGPFEQRICFVVLAGELQGPGDALNLLDRLGHDRVEGQLAVPANGAELTDLLRRLYAGYERTPKQVGLTEVEQRELRRRLGWFADLALAPPDGPDPGARARVLAAARRSALSQILVVVGGLLAAVVGACLLIVGIALIAVGRLPVADFALTGNGGIYAETFAVYMVLYLALSSGIRWLPLSQGRLLLNAVAMLGSLSALAWPRLRGVSWPQIRYDLGWFIGPRPALERLAGKPPHPPTPSPPLPTEGRGGARHSPAPPLPSLWERGLGGEGASRIVSEFLYGLGCYLSALPLVLLGLMLTLALMQAQRWLGWGPDPFGPGAPTHPIVGLALRADIWDWLQLVFIASICAPLIEETMFRGALYRHLREIGAGRLSRPASVLFSATWSSLVFAAIHPQGFLAVPVLMALAIAFALAREWRQTLLPPMIAHGINNGVVTLVLALSTS